MRENLHILFIQDSFLHLSVRSLVDNHLQSFIFILMTLSSYTSLIKNANRSFEKLNGCSEDVKKWLSTSKLKLNPDKTEFNIFGSKLHHEKLKSWRVNIFDNVLHPAKVVKCVGVWFNSNFLFLGMFRVQVLFCTIEGPLETQTATYT